MQRESGFTLTELLIVVAVLVPLLGSMAAVGTVVTKTVDTNDRASDTTEQLRRSMRRIGSLLRPAKLSSFEVQATAQDVTDGLATAIGDWISPTDLAPREGVRFVAAEGLLSMNAGLSTPPRELVFELEPGEKRNLRDDDGDNLVDEGHLVMTYGTIRVPVMTGIELCQFTFDGRMVRATLRGTKIDSSRRVHRATIEQSFYVRNN